MIKSDDSGDDEGSEAAGESGRSDQLLGIV